MSETYCQPDFALLLFFVFYFALDYKESTTVFETYVSQYELFTLSLTAI